MASHPQVRGHFKEEPVSDAAILLDLALGSLAASAAAHTARSSASMKQHEKAERHRSLSEIVMGSRGNSWVAWTSA
ncbi:hypothetical protein E4U52_003795 [Claviceps spartinae]|nr:hypothetical protein E4U52_003795 [Claviceps spartinae]